MSSSVFVYVVSGVVLSVLLATAITWTLPDENRVIPAPGVGESLIFPNYRNIADPAALEKGRVYYAQICMPCHGVRGDGFGEWAYRVVPRPADLRSQRVQRRSNDDLFEIVSDGLTGTSMIGWRSQLSDHQRRQVVSYLRTFGSGGDKNEQ